MQDDADENFSNDSISAICRPLSALKYKKRRIIILVLIIWTLSILISLPELFILEAIPFLSDENLFPCVEKVGLGYEIVQPQPHF